MDAFNFTQASQPGATYNPPEDAGQPGALDQEDLGDNIPWIEIIKLITAGIKLITALIELYKKFKFPENRGRDRADIEAGLLHHPQWTVEIVVL